MGRGPGSSPLARGPSWGAGMAGGEPGRRRGVQGGLGAVAPSPLGSLWELPLPSACWARRITYPGGQAFESG